MLFGSCLVNRRLYPSHASRDAFFFFDLKRTNVFGVLDMRAGADFLADARNRIHTYLCVVVLLSKEGDGACFLGVSQRHFFVGDVGVCLYPLINLLLHLFFLFLG